MPRQPRVQAAGMYHVWDHAVANAPLFGDRHDFAFRLGLLEEAVRLGRMRCHAFCLMGTHEHLLLSVEDGQLATLMQRLNRNYAGKFNWRHGRRGRVYWAPYGSSLVDRDEYLTWLIPYFALNPEWAGRDSAERYVWSSYAGLIGRRQAVRFVDQTPLLDIVGGGQRAVERIEALVANARVLGRRRIEAQVADPYVVRDDVPGVGGRAPSPRRRGRALRPT